MIFNKKGDEYFNKTEIKSESIISAPCNFYLRCIKQVNPMRNNSDGWIYWKTTDRIFIDNSWKSTAISGLQKVLRRRK